MSDNTKLIAWARSLSLMDQDEALEPLCDALKQAEREKDDLEEHLDAAMMVHHMLVKERDALRSQIAEMKAKLDSFEKVYVWISEDGDGVDIYDADAKTLLMQVEGWFLYRNRAEEEADEQVSPSSDTGGMASYPNPKTDTSGWGEQPYGDTGENK